MKKNNWMNKWLNDPFVKIAKNNSYLSRAAYKLIEINDIYHIFQHTSHVLDIGAAPGSWSQVALSQNTNIHILAIDVLPIHLNHIPFYLGQTQESHHNSLDIFFKQNIKHVDNMQKRLFFCQMRYEDFYQILQNEPSIQNKVYNFDLILSDASINLTGIAEIDGPLLYDLHTYIATTANKLISKSGILVLKIFRKGYEKRILEHIQRLFNIVDIHKPHASKQDSSEIYIIAKYRKDNINHLAT